MVIVHTWFWWEQSAAQTRGQLGCGDSDGQMIRGTQCSVLEKNGDGLFSTGHLQVLNPLRDVKNSPARATIIELLPLQTPCPNST